MKNSNAFTMIELIFVIVVLGILSAIALPKFAGTRVLADIGKGRADVATIRTAIINERQSRLLLGDNSFIPVLSSAKLFDGNGTSQLLKYGMTDSTTSGNWHKVDDTTYEYRVGDNSVNTFTYTPADGKFMCTGGVECSKLTD
ncbi:type II secretion system protein [Sulfurimonas sp.]|uniref:type II secretion system protein n=1 Tax=Sulfurimonas sp. TaxID=2022749 RepID=UPI0025FBE817|nr:type II secretion system protein [Sulfurimonas sp.]MDD5158013.1 type II secretion system protein [Sulfurimonas sp.]